MPVFERYSIERYKEILINQPAGNIKDGGFSTYSLDDPDITPNGTGDFLGVIKTIVLIGEVYRQTIDTRNMSFNQFNNLTQDEFDDYVRQGMILLNRTSNGQPQRIGWVEIGRSHASFYYQSCSGGKRPVSEHYFDIQEFSFNNKTVIGEGSEIEPTEALTPIGNFDQNITNNLGVLRPRFEPLNLTDYIRFAMIGTITNPNGESIRINDLSLTDQKIPTQVSLLMANRGDHFDNQFANEVSSGKWGMIRRTISESLKPGVHIIYSQNIFSISQQNNGYSLDFSKTEGQCLELNQITFNDDSGVIVRDVSIGINKSDRINIEDLNLDKFYAKKPYLECFENLSINFDQIQNTLTTSKNGMGSIITYGIPKNTNNTDNVIQFNRVHSIRNQKQLIRAFYNIRDPREFYNDNLNIPSGILHSYLKDGCQLEVIPAYLPKDGQIPEPIGPHRNYNLEDVREYLQVNYKFYDKTLYPIDKGVDGIVKYSDGLSYREYAATSAYGWHSFRHSANLFTLYPSKNVELSLCLKIPTREEIDTANSQGLFNNSSAYFMYENTEWKKIIDFLVDARESAFSFIRKDGKPIKIQMDDISYKKLYDSEFIKVVVLSKSSEYFSINQIHSNIFLGFNDYGVFSYKTHDELLNSLDKNDNVSYEKTIINRRNIQYGKNPLKKIGHIDWINLSRFSSPSIKVSPDGSLYIELIDTTYLLDIYHSLMNLHLAQVEWKIIIDYIKECENIISFGNIDEFNILYQKIKTHSFFENNSLTDILNPLNESIWPPKNPFTIDEFGNLI
jgi:hypothetical protein